MPVGVCAPMEGMDVLEQGLKTLKRSRMMTVREFKDMFGAIEKHHRDLSLAHLTGKSKDLRDQAERDTKFYHILVKMLCEVRDVKTGKQLESLKKVHTWYLANKHVLYSGPHFGKEYQKQEAQEAFKKAVTPRNPPPSRDKRRASQHSAKSSQSNQPPSSNGHVSEQQQTQHIPTHPKSASSQRTHITDVEVSTDRSLVNEDDGLDDSLIAELQSGLETLGNVDFRCDTPTVTITPARGQSTTPHPDVPEVHRRMVHSVASLVNPHAQPSLTLTPEQEGPVLLSQRPTTAPALREDILHSWRTYNMDVAYGQDMISKLNFVGRSGTTCDVRYTAHENGEMPELNTRHYLQGIPVKHPGPNENQLLNQTLEDFYQTTDSYYPTNLPKYRNKPKSAPAQRRASQGREFQQNGHQEQPSTNVKLDAVIGLIDSVTDNMAVHREVIAPRPHPGFRQPSASGIPSRPATSRSGRSGSRQHTPSARTNTPVTPASGSRPRLVNSPASSPREDILIHDPVTPEVMSPAPPRSASAIDWRGRITPNSVRYKWGKTKFGGHTYIKNLNKPRSLRSAGSTSAGSRPKTAPVSSRKKTKVQTPRDSQSRIAQAASHTTVEVEQQDLDSMMVIQHLLGSSESRRDSFGSFAFDDDFFKTIRNISPGSMTVPQAGLEYLSFVTSTHGAVTPREGPACQLPKAEDHGSLTADTDIGSLSERLSLLNAETGNQTEQAAGSISSGAEHRDTEGEHRDTEAAFRDICDVDEDHTDVTQEHKTGDVDNTTSEAIAALLGLSTDPDKPQLQDPPDLSLNLSAEEPSSDPALPVDVPTAEDESEAVQVAVTSIPASGQGPPHPQQRQAPLQTLSKSNTWSYIPGFDREDTEQEEVRPNTQAGTADLKLKTAFTQYRITDHFPETLDTKSEDISRATKMTTRIERSAGRMPGQPTSGHPVRTTRRVNELFRRAPPIRTPPSIPTPYNMYGGRSPRGGNVFNKELEQHARKVRSPRHYLEHDRPESHQVNSSSKKVRELRQHGPPRSAPPILTNNVDVELSGTLQVCRLPTREKTVTITTEAEFDGPPSILKNADSIEGFNRESPDFEKQVTFGSASDIQEQETDNNKTSPSKEEEQTEAVTESGQTSKVSSVPSTPVSRQPLARVGRPIATYQNVPDPDELSKAVQLQKEASAAVDIQRIFRGYVARGAYRKLVSEEREKMEEEQRKKLNSRKQHREHVARTQAIYNRGPKPDDIEWQKDYQNIKEQKKRERQYKMDSISRENAYNHHTSNSTISVIGPHVEIYQVYHPKKTGPSQKEFNQFALMIQKHIRGWIIRRRLEKLKRKAAWSGVSFERMVKDYKTMLARVQRQHGKERAKTPFTFKQMNEYMDLRRRYESVFEKKAFGGELEMDELDQFFKECDLYPSQAELDEAVDVIFRGRGLKGRGLKKKEVLDIVFYIYVPDAAGLENTRTSTWMSPIIDGVEARRLIGSEAVEPAPLEVCAKLVIASKRERRERENRALREQLARQESSDDSDEGEQRRQMKAKLRTYSISNNVNKEPRPPA